MIKLTNINKYYTSSLGKFHALKDINLTLPDQGMVYIVGKSGSGKSTLLNVIGGIDNYDSGSLTITDLVKNDDGSVKEVNLDTANFKRKDYNGYRNTYIGFIFQEFNVIKGLTVFENIALSLELQQLNVKEHHQEILDIIEKVGLKGKEKRRINELSGGERQRVAIARALIKNPKIIIADEPTGNLDGKNRDIVMDILKDLSKDKLVLIVTHDKYLASRYGDRKITIKDGAIIDDEIIHQENLKDNLVTTHQIKPIAPKASVSLKLAWRNFLLNKVRFIFIMILFSLSLIFAGSVVNLFLANTTEEYANFQKDYDNFVISLSTKYNYHDTVKTTGFFTYDLSQAKKLFKNEGTDLMTSYSSMKVSIPIDDNKNSTYENLNDFYKNNIENITIYKSDNDLKSSFQNVYENLYSASVKNSSSYCYITDYLVNSLSTFNYFGEKVTADSVIGKAIMIPGCTYPVRVAGVIETNFNNFSFLNEKGTLEKDSKYKASYTDNLAIYNSLFMESGVYENCFSGNGLSYYYDDIIYRDKKKNTEFNDVKFTCVKSSDTLLAGNYPLKPKENEITQIAVSRGFLEKVLNLNVNSIEFVQGSNNTLLGSTTDKITYTYYFCGVRRIPTSIESTISGIIDSDELIVYTPTLNEDTLYNRFVRCSYVEGGFLTTIINDNPTINSNIYRNLLDNDIAINNPSFVKLQLVDDFINDNIYLFAALFFTFGLFSVLMIFNFIIINIKNSTRDIGIYMSLGMNGFKIALIYLFQVLIISTVACLIGLIGSSIFLFVIDSSFNATALIDFKILKNTFLGVLAIIGIAYLTPFIAIVSPLLSLSRKKPIDVIKVS